MSYTHTPIITGWWFTTWKFCVCLPLQHYYIYC